MKKYKLIKEYPGSPKLGTVVEYKDDQYQLYLIENKTSNYGQFPKTYVENLPEFWEKIKEQEYKILSFSKPKIIEAGNNIFTLRENGNYFNHSNPNFGIGIATGLPISYFLSPEQGHEIHSIQRLYDGEIFTIGDEIEFYGDEFIITDFSIDLDWGGQIRVGRMGGAIAFSGIKKLKKPLFKTEDGVEVYEGDDVYIMDNYFLKYIEKVSELQAYKTWRLTFKYKEKAKEYILMNKPCLSLQEIIDIIGFKNNIRQGIVKNLIEFTKNKFK
jgi:hypothetical protein